MSKIFTILILLQALISEAQVFWCTEASKSELLSGKALKKGSAIKQNDIIIVKKKGFVSLAALGVWELSLNEPGNYSVDSIYQLYLNQYAAMDSTYVHVLTGNLLDCQFKRLCEGNDNESLYRMGNIVLEGREIERKDTVDAILNLSMKCKTPYTGNYYVVVYNYFEAIIDIQKTKATTASIDLALYYEKYFRIVIVRDDCTRSGDYVFWLR